MPHDFEGSILTGEYCYIPVPQVNSISISICLMTFPQMQTVVHYLTKCMPPCSLWISLPVISHNNPSPSLHSPQPILCQWTSSPHHFTIWAQHSWSTLAWSYYPDDLFHHMFVSPYHMFVSCTAWVLQFYYSFTF